jgi:hypothetical protein
MQDSTKLSEPQPTATQSVAEEICCSYTAMMDAIGDNMLDAADGHLDKLMILSGRHAEHPDVMLFRTIIAIQRGCAIEALQALNSIGEDFCPELRTLCLYSIQDPLWEGLAQDLQNSADTRVAEAMRDMLDLYHAVRSGF